MAEDSPSPISYPGTRRWITIGVLLTLLWCIAMVSWIAAYGNPANTLHSQIVTGCMSLIPLLFGGLGLPGMINALGTIFTVKKND